MGLEVERSVYKAVRYSRASEQDHSRLNVRICENKSSSMEHAEIMLSYNITFTKLMLPFGCVQLPLCFLCIFQNGALIRIKFEKSEMAVEKDKDQDQLERMLLLLSNCL